MKQHLTSRRTSRLTQRTHHNCGIDTNRVMQSVMRSFRKCLGNHSSSQHWQTSNSFHLKSVKFELSPASEIFTQRSYSCLVSFAFSRQQILIEICLNTKISSHSVNRSCANVCWAQQSPSTGRKEQCSAK